MPTTTVIALDCQYDYLPGGSIDAFGSANALNNLAQVAATADLVVVTRDWHPENHFSFVDEPEFTDQSWPPHCVQGTKGAKIFPALRKRADFVVSKGLQRNPPDDYSAFVGKTLRPVELLPNLLAANLTDIVIIGGFLLEIGVKFTAHDANVLGWWDKVIVPLDCTATMQSDKKFEIANPLKRVGIEVVEHWKDIGTY